MAEDTRKHEIQLEAILKRLEEKDPTEMGGMFGNKAKDLTTSKDFTRLESFLEEVHDELDKDTNQLKADAKTNKLANALQVAKELIQFKTETAFYKKQVKHNAGARDARIKIIKQNDEIIARNKDLQKLLKEARGRAAGGGGTGGGTGGAPPVTGGGTGGGPTGTGGGTGGGDGGGTGGGLTPAQLEEELAAQLQGYDSVEDKIKQTGWQSDEQKASYMKQKKIDREKATTELRETASARGRAPKRMEIETKRGPSRKVDTAAEVNSSDGTRRDPTAWGTPGMIEGTPNDEFFSENLTSSRTLDSKQAAKDREDVFGDKGLGENDKNMRKIRLGREREGLVRAERDKTGNIKFRDEQRGSYADATQFIKSEGAVGALAGDIRAGMGYAGGTRNRAASMASRGSATLSKNLGQNAADVQKQMDDLREKDAEAANKAQTELATLSKMMATQAAGGKDADGKKVTADEVREQAARVEQVMETTKQGKKMNKMLGMSDVRDDLSSERGFTTALKNFGGVDSGKDGKPIGFGAGMKQAFTAERLFGKDSKLASVFGGGGQAVENRVAEAKATQQLAVEDQAAGVKSALSEDRLGILTDKNLGIEETEEAVEKIEAKQAVAVEEASAKVEESKEVGATVQAETTAKKKDTKERTGQDTETVQEKQLETLIEIRDILERTAGGGGGGGGPGAVPPPGLFKRLFGGGKKPPVPGAKPGAKPPGRMARMFSKGGAALKGAGPAAQGFAQGSGGGLMKGALRGASRFGGAIAGVGLGIYEGVTGFKDAGARGDAGEIGAEEEQIAKGEAIGGGAGGAGGAIAGAAAGAAIGSVIPVVGTVIGGLVGGAMGYFAGRWAGKKAGGAIADAIPVSAEQLAESNKLAETTLENVEERDSELAATIQQEAKEIETQMLEEAGDEVSDNDKAAIENAALVKAIQNHTNEIDALPEPTDATQSPGARKWDKQQGLVKAGTGTSDTGDFGTDQTNQASVDELTQGGAVGIARNMGFTNEEIASPGGPLSSYQMSSDLGGARITSLGGREVSQEQSDQFRIQKKIMTSGEDALFNETTQGELGGELVEGGMTPTPIAEQKQPKSRGTARGRAMRARLNRVKAFSNTKGIIDFDEGMPLNKGIDKAGDPAKIEAFGAAGMAAATLPTGEAITNMTDLTAATAEENPPTVVVANQPAPPAPVAPSDGPNIAVMPPRVRTSDSVIQRYQDKRFRV